LSVEQDPVTRLKINAKMRMLRTEQKVAALRAEIARPNPVGGVASVARLQAILAERVADAEAARRAYDEILCRPDWQLLAEATVDNG